MDSLRRTLTQNGAGASPVTYNAGSPVCYVAEIVGVILLGRCWLRPAEAITSIARLLEESGVKCCEAYVNP